MPDRQPRRTVPGSNRPVNRRSHAPIRPSRPPTILPDVLVACAAAAWAMGLTLLVVSLFHQLTPGGAGPILARLFGAALLLCGFFIMGLGIALMRDERNEGVHYRVPGIVGGLAGLFEIGLILNTAGYLLVLPSLLLVFVIPPLRNAIEPGRKRRR